jgi:hypothetical protein
MIPRAYCRLFPFLLSSLYPVVCSFTAFAESSNGVTDADLLLARNPIIIKDRLRFADEFTDVDGGGNSNKSILSGVYGFGFNGRDKNFAFGFELPYLYNNPEVGNGDSGIGDIKLRFGHLLMEDPKGWRAGWFFDTEFDTAADSVQAIANQRTQMTLGTGASYAILSNFTLSSTLQYGWSLDDGTTTGRKQEWEAHLTAITKLSERFSLNLDYKAVINTVGGTRFYNTLEPSAGWVVGDQKDIGLFTSCELPLYGGGANWVAKAGLIWFF